jgi:hypothetical protein
MYVLAVSGWFDDYPRLLVKKVDLNAPSLLPAKQIGGSILRVTL